MDEPITYNIMACFVDCLTTYTEIDDNSAAELKSTGIIAVLFSILQKQFPPGTNLLGSVLRCLCALLDGPLASQEVGGGVSFVQIVLQILPALFDSNGNWRDEYAAVLSLKGVHQLITHNGTQYPVSAISL